MKKPKKSYAGNKRRSRETGQARRRAEQQVRKEDADQPSNAHEANPYEPGSPYSAAGRKPQRNEDERKRKLWERKQAELEARRLTALSRQTEENLARKRAMRIAYSITGTVVAVLLCALAWYFAQDAMHIDTPA